jgi:polysaccharide pyruvyl transferase WcaK-like protein
MLEANLAALRRLVPGIRFTVFSGDPAWSSRRYAVDAIELPTPAAGPRPIRAALEGATALLISGGGNLCATWPDKIHERSVLIAAARVLRLPTAIVGQTLGPALTPPLGAELASVLPWAGFVGVRDDNSAALAAALGVEASRIHTQLDDAYLMEPEAVTDGREAAVGGSTPLAVVTLDASFGTPHRADELTALASQLDGLADMLGAALVFVPHVGGADVPAGHSDAVAGEALRARLRSPMALLGLWEPREVRWLIGRAALVVSSRYHPIVFATAACVPAIGIHQDEYTQVKLTGAFAHARLEHWCLALGDAARGALLTRAAELRHSRASVEAALARLRAGAEARESRRWQLVCQSLGLAPGVAHAGRSSSAAPIPHHHHTTS